MRFQTQHIRVSQGHTVFQLHRDGNVTWKTIGDGVEQGASEVTVHDTVAQAKALFGNITSAGK